ncbi:MAG: ISAs1 family transposase [Ketobacter sp.]|nr:ISAs1 family transposase [Ketobacter sp.]
MCDTNALSIREHFGSIPDPRIDRQKRHNLVDIFTITLCAAICGAEAWTHIEEFGKAKQDWFRSFLELPNGIPSHDTFGRFFSLLDPQAFQDAFLQWVQSVNDVLKGQVVAIDGKCLRRSHDRNKNKSAIYMVSAWASANQLVLGQVKTDEKSNEITAIPKLLRALEIKGCIVTIDAAGCQKNIAAQIRSQGADYVLALKGNQGNLREYVEDYFTTARENNFLGVPHDYFETTDGGHGRVEIRRHWTIDQFGDFPGKKVWNDLNTIGMVESERHIGDEITIDRRYYITSLTADAEQFASCVRAHWGVENGLHWCLDVSFREDDCRVRQGYASENFAVIRHIAMNLLKKEKSFKGGLKAKRLRAGWVHDYLIKILAGG